ncbi:unnamed protein product [Rotaria sp. Silwood1]|nr:unnamed protein product [Rotaria sp. Silwood1]
MSEISLRRIEFDRENRLYELFISTNDLSIIKSNCQNQNYDISWLMAFGRYLKTIRINSHLICSNKLLYEFIQHILNENIEINHGLFLILKQCIYLYPDKLINLSFQHYLSNILLITLDSYLKYKYIRLLYLIINKIDEKFLNKIFPLKENLLNNYYQYDISIIIILENLVLINSDIEFQLLINKIYNNNTLYEYLKLNDFDDDEIIDLCYILFQINLKKNLSCIFNISNIFIDLLKYINYDIDTMINWLLTPETGEKFLIFILRLIKYLSLNHNELKFQAGDNLYNQIILIMNQFHQQLKNSYEKSLFPYNIICKKCDTKLGWMYEFATEESQRYKEGRVILERALINETVGF